ncbi:MAG: tryptophan synthase subunit alpha [Thiotrichaceae bacterium]
MNRLDDCFKQLKLQQRSALIPINTAGDPRSEITLPLMHALVNAGADVLEIGMPFSDPMADGPVIQRASERALAAGMTLQGVLELMAEFRRSNTTTPIVLMGYLNPVETMGYAKFAATAQAAGVDGVLIVDLPPEESHELTSVFHHHDLSLIFLLAPTSTPERIAKICQQARGYLYYVSLKGVTGSASLDIDTVAKKIQEIREHTQLPVGVGFGISNAETAAKMAQISDAVIVGSALVKQIEMFSEAEVIERIASFLKEFRVAMDAAVDSGRDLQNNNH